MSWYCVLCGKERNISDFGEEPCDCGGQAMQTRPIPEPDEPVEVEDEQ